MTTPKRLQALERLTAAWERVYVWSSSGPEIRFDESDRQRMVEPLVRLRQTGEWIAASAIAGADWFIGRGAELMLERIDKGDYDLYEDESS